MVTCPSSSNWPMIAQIFVVPISSPLINFCRFLRMFFDRWPLAGDGGAGAGEVVMVLSFRSNCICPHFECWKQLHGIVVAEPNLHTTPQDSCNALKVRHRVMR